MPTQNPAASPATRFEHQLASFSPLALSGQWRVVCPAHAPNGRLKPGACRVFFPDIAPPICEAEAAKLLKKNHPRSGGSRRRPLGRERPNEEKEAG